MKISDLESPKMSVEGTPIININRVSEKTITFAT